MPSEYERGAEAMREAVIAAIRLREMNCRRLGDNSESPLQQERMYARAGSCESIRDLVVSIPSPPAAFSEPERCPECGSGGEGCDSRGENHDHGECSPCPDPWHAKPADPKPDAVAELAEAARRVVAQPIVMTGHPGENVTEVHRLRPILRDLRDAIDAYEQAEREGGQA